jgi:hypothetical protein
VAQALAGISSTTSISPLVLRYAMSNPAFTSYISLIGNNAIYGSGTYGVTVHADYASPYIQSLNAKACFVPSNNVVVNSLQGRGKTDLVTDWTKPMWFSYRFRNASNGDATTICRVTVGKTASTFGDLAVKGFGIKWAGGSSGAFTVMAHDGTTLTTLASSVTVSSTTYFPTVNSAADFLIYSDGAGNVTVYCNNVQIVTTTGGPSSGTTTQTRLAFETDNSTTYTSAATPAYSGIRSMLAY